MGGNRKRNRLPGYDYSQAGYYYVTICTKERGEIFGRIKNGEMELNQYGNFALQYFQEIPSHYHGVVLDEYVLMPDHVHGIFIINQPVTGLGSRNETLIEPGNMPGNVSGTVRTEQCSVPTFPAFANITTINPDDPGAAGIMNENHNERYGLLSKIIKSYKEIVVKTIGKQYNDYGFTWQRSFYDHLIRNEEALNKIREYIRNNPAKWGLKD